jgi:hypothetical protein
MHLPGAHYTLLSDQSPSGVATVTFGPSASLPQVYDDLLVVIPTLWSSVSTGTPTLKMSFNSDTTTSNYWQSWWRHLGSALSAGESADFLIMRAAGQNIVAPMMGQIWIPNYAGTTDIKRAQSESVSVFKTSFASSSLLANQHYAMLWNSTNAISEIDFTYSDASNFASGTRMLLYGVSYSRP